MYLCFHKKNLVVADFQLIYDTDNLIQLDFYAEGIRIEPLLYDQKIFSERINYGFLKGTYIDYQKDQQFFMNLMEDSEWVDITSKRMVKSIHNLHKLTKMIERALDEKQLSLPLWESYFYSIANAISFKRFSNTCDPIRYSESEEQFEFAIKNMRIPSHVLLFYKKLEQLKKDPNDVEIRSFIKKYGFLYDFNIAATPFENISDIKGIIQNQQEALLQVMKEDAPMKSAKNINDNNFGVILYKRLAWYEEMRHYYQARALRNYRLIFEQLNLDIYCTGIDDFHNKLKEEIRHVNYL